MSPVTVTAAQSGSTADGIVLSVEVLTGAAEAQDGARAALNAGGFAAQHAITTTAAGSSVYGALRKAGVVAAFTADAATTLLDSIHDSNVEVDYGTCRTTALTVTPGTVTVGASAPGGAGHASGAYAEILPAGVIATDPSSPPAVSDVDATEVTTAEFSPPAGSLVVAMVSSNGGSSVVQMAVTSSGLAFAPLQEVRPLAAGYCGVWAAQA